MLKFLKLWVLLCLILAANPSFAESVEITDRQIEYKEAYERTKAFHEQRLQREMSDERPQASEAHNPTAIESVQLRSHKVMREFKLAGDFLANKFDSFSKYIRLKWRTFTGVKSIPPFSYGLYYLFVTGGTYPEVIWYPDRPSDSDGYIERYEFTFGDGTTQIIPASDIEPGKSISHVYSQPGTYAASLKIVDNDGDFSVYTNSVTITGTNTLPLPKFTLQNNQVPDFLKVDFTSQATDEGSIIRYSWGFGDGSADVVGGSATTATRTYATPGIYNVTFSARDNLRGQMKVGTQAYVGVHQPAGGMPPIPVVYANTLAGPAPLSVQFDGEKSFDIGGSIASYSWDFGDYANPLNNSRKSKPSFSYTQPGTYYGSLTVVDNGGRSALRYFAVYVYPENGPDVPAQILAYPSSASRSFWFESNYRAISAATPSYYQVWDFGDGSPAVKGVYPSHTYASDGVYTVTLKVYDVRGAVQQIQKSITVNANQSAPISSFALFPNNTVVGATVNLTTFNPNFVNPTTTAVWDFGDGTRQTGLHRDLLNTTHVYTQKGFYLVSLTTTDELGKSSTTSQYLNVQNISRPIQIAIDVNPRLGNIPLPTRIDGRGTSSSAGSIVKYFWQVFGPTGLITNESSVWTPTFSVGGDYYVNLFVEDSAGNVGLSSDYISVVDPAQIPAMNRNPNAVIQMNFFQTGENSGAFLTAYNSWDPDGDRIVEYAWIFDGSIVSTGPTAQIFPSGKNISRMVSLRVKDKWGASGEQKFYFRNPTLSFDHVPLNPLVDTPAHFLVDEETMDLPDGNAIEYRWNFGDGTPMVYGANPSHTFVSPGTYNVSVVVKDIHSNTYTSTKTIVVEAETPPVIVITAKDPSNVMEASGAQVFRWNTFPADVNFDLTKSSTQGGGIHSAVWDFGDGSLGFGVNPSYNYQKPGTYTVSVTATDTQGNSNNANLQVVIDKWNCSNADGVDGCLKLPNSQGHALPMSENEWLVSHDVDPLLTWNPDVGDTSYVHLNLVDTEEEGEDINITSAIVVDGTNLKIQKSLLPSLGVDFLSAYRITVRTKLSDGSEYNGTFPKVYFGVGTVNISTTEPEIKLTVTGVNGYRKYVDLNTSTSYVLGNLMTGTYTIVAEKGNLNSTYTVTISDSTAQNVVVDLSLPMIEKNKKDREKFYKKTQAELSNQETSYVNDLIRRAVRIKSTSSISWDDGCGNMATYPLAPPMSPPPAGISYIYFGSGGRGSPPEDMRMDRSFGEKLKFHCSIYGGYHRYTAIKWSYYDGVKRCWNYSNGPITPDAYDGWYYWKNLTAAQPGYPITINWKIQDPSSGQEFSGKHVTSMAQAMAAEGITPENITKKIGFSAPGGGVPSVKYDATIDIPKNLLRPKLTVTLDSVHNGTVVNDSAFGVNCNLEKEDAVLPRIVKIGAVPTQGALTMAEDNGARFLANKLFPVGIDTILTSGTFNLPESFKARLKLQMHSGTYDPEDIEEIKVVMKYGGTEVGSRIYNLQPSDYLDVTPSSSKFNVLLTVDAEDFANFVTYIPNEEKRIELEFVPMGSSFDEENAGSKSINAIIPLFNAKNYSANLCKNGVYNPDSTIMYGASELLDTLHALSNPVTGDPVNFRCNDMSLPWGGRFAIANIKHSGHMEGKNVDIRYFNTGEALQSCYDQRPPGSGVIDLRDCYDKGPASVRRQDLNTYISLANWAHKVATENNTSYASIKAQILTACQGGNFYFPCNGTTTLATLTKEKILQLCQWHNIVDGLCSAEAVGYKDAIARYSIWAEYNMKTLLKIRGIFGEILMSGGFDFPLASTLVAPSNVDWQTLGIDLGLWPDQSPIYKIIGSNISTDAINTCFGGGSCGLRQYFSSRNKDHLHHIHLGKSKR